MDGSKYILWWLLPLGLAALIVEDVRAQITYPDRSAPAKGGFNWTKFAGKYDIGECQSHPSPIWGGGPIGTFVQIDHIVDYTRSPSTDRLELMRANNGSAFGLGWSVERIGHARRTETHAKTGKVVKVVESYATADGVYGMMAWDQPHNVGWSTLQLRMDTQGKISLTIRQRNDSDASTREETCRLTKHIPEIRI